MDQPTELALRAIIRGMHLAGVIDDSQIMAIMSSIDDQANDEQAHSRPVHADELSRLSRALAKDAAISEHPAET